jgi:hypothetical protein
VGAGLADGAGAEGAVGEAEGAGAEVAVGEAEGAGAEVAVGVAEGSGAGDGVSVGVAVGAAVGEAAAGEADGDGLETGEAIAGTTSATVEAVMTWPGRMGASALVVLAGKAADDAAHDPADDAIPTLDEHAIAAAAPAPADRVPRTIRALW